MAIHVMAALSYNRGKTLPSATLASTVGTNPSFLRQLIGRLAAAGLVETKLGKGGGTTLRANASEVTLLDIYRATSSPELIPQHSACVDGRCVVADAIPSMLSDVDTQLRRVVETELANTRLDSLIARYVR